MSKKEPEGPAIDLSFGIEMAAELKAGFQGIHDREREQRRREEELIPLDLVIRGGGTAPPSGDLIFSCEGPPLGRAWVLRRLVIGGTDPAVAVAGSAYCFASSAGDQDQLITATVFDWAATMPLVGFYTSRQVVIQSGQRLWIKITSPTAGTSYALAGSVLSEIANERAAARWTL